MLQLDADHASLDQPQPSRGGGEGEQAAPARSSLGVARKLGRGSLTSSLAGFGPSLKGDGDEEPEGVETGGEDQADKVEAAVKQGKSARSALGGGEDEQEGAEQDGDDREQAAAPGAGRAMSAGPARKRPQLKDADGPRFGVGFTASRNGLEASKTYKLWDKDPPIEIPIAAVPGLNAMIEPSVVVKIAGGVDWKKKSVKAAFGVDGGVGVGFSYGNAKIASVYGIMEAKAFGGFEYERSSPCEWELDGKIELSTNFKVGVKLGGGIVDYGYEFGKCVLGTLTGISFKNGHFQKDKLGWDWGPKPKEFFAAVKAGIAKAKKQIDRVKKPIKAVLDSGADAINALTSW